MVLPYHGVFIGPILSLTGNGLWAHITLNRAKTPVDRDDILVTHPSQRQVQSPRPLLPPPKQETSKAKRRREHEPTATSSTVTNSHPAAPPRPSAPHSHSACSPIKSYGLPGFSPPHSSPAKSVGALLLSSPSNPPSKTLAAAPRSDAVSVTSPIPPPPSSLRRHGRPRGHPLLFRRARCRRRRRGPVPSSRAAAGACPRGCESGGGGSGSLPQAVVLRGAPARGDHHRVVEEAAEGGWASGGHTAAAGCGGACSCCTAAPARCGKQYSRCCRCLSDRLRTIVCATQVCFASRCKIGTRTIRRGYTV
jgi:hypothetical protein